MDTLIGRSKRGKTRLDWIAQLPEVGAPILRSLDQLRLQSEEIRALQAQLRTGRISLLKEVSSLWSAKEIAGAKL